MFRRLLISYCIRRRLKQEYENNNISRREYRHLVKAARGDICEAVVDSIQTKGEIGDGVILSQVWKFIQDNWDEILKVLITLAAAILMDGDDD